MKNLLIFIITLMFSFYCQISFCQREVAPEFIESQHNISIQAMGGISFYSLNYERLLFNKGKFRINGTVGIGRSIEFMFFTDAGGWNATPRGAVSILYGNKRNRFEIATTIEVYNGTYRPNRYAEFAKQWKYVTSVYLGYRFVPKDIRKLFIKVNFSLPVKSSIFKNNSLFPLYFAPSISIGKAFGKKSK